jgi:NAD(P)-dependent dehydrogenase (short-subunit alcohol dehydrogenase family)
MESQSLINLDGKTAIITGGAMGIGHSIAKRLAEAGADVIIADINVAKGEEAIGCLNNDGNKAAFVKCDITISSDVKKVLEHACTYFGGLDILVNNVGWYPLRPFLEVDSKFWDRVMDVNLKGAYFSCLEATRQLVKQERGGVIINVASQSSFVPEVNNSVYNIAKAGMIMLTKNLALDLARYNIRVNAICPGATLTPGQKDNIKWLKQDFLPRTPLGRLAQPDDIANTALFLASPISSHITGTYILCDGGYSLT